MNRDVKVVGSVLAMEMMLESVRFGAMYSYCNGERVCLLESTRGNEGGKS